MKAVVINEDGTVSVQHTEKPKITSPEQILVKIAYSGLYGSDIPRIFHHGAHYYPIILGNEFSGHVVELGHDVTEFAVGDLISCIPLLPCFECEACLQHYYSICKSYTFVGSQISGGFAEYIVLNKKIPSNYPTASRPLKRLFFNQWPLECMHFYWHMLSEQISTL